MKIRNVGAIIVDEIRYDFLIRAFKEAGRKKSLLDLGCGVKPFSSLYNKYTEKSVGIDVAQSPHGTSHADKIYDGKTIPFEDASFDIVFCTEVMEHVPEPTNFLNEINRVLQPGGMLIMTTPFMVPLHEEPYDFYRYTKYGIRHLLEKSSFEKINIEPFGDYFGVVIAISIQIMVKFWRILANKTGMKFLYTPWNLFIFLFVVIPQWMYLLYYRAPILGRVKKYLSATTRGYGYTAIKK